jgi:hypothetical protein
MLVVGLATNLQKKLLGLQFALYTFSLYTFSAATKQKYKASGGGELRLK